MIGKPSKNHPWRKNFKEWLPSKSGNKPIEYRFFEKPDEDKQKYLNFLQQVDTNRKLKKKNPR